MKLAGGKGMSDRIEQLKSKFIEFWSKYNTKQKIVIFSLVGGIAIALLLVSYFVTRPTYVQLARIEDARSASEMIDALDEAGIVYKYNASDRYTIIEVEQGNLSEATLLIESSDALKSGMTWDEALDNDMSTTTSEKRTKTTLALQTSLRKALLQ